MGKKILLITSILSLFLIFTSCSKNDSNPLNSYKKYDWDGEIGKYNYAYDDSLLFTSARSEGTNFAPNIYIMHKDGSGIRPLTNNYFTFGACYSPRRWKVLFIADTSFMTNSRILYMMDLESGNKKVISEPGEDVWSVACSPDGKKIAYIVLNSKKGKIRVLDTKDSTTIDITDWYGSSNFKTISWSTDSKNIVFDGLPGSRIGLANVDGSGYKELFTSKMGCYFPRWAKTENKIVYSSYALIDSNYYSNIFVYNIFNQTIEQITNLKSFNYDPCWSSDDNHIIFASKIDNNFPSFLYKVDLTTKQITQLTNGIGGDWSPFL
jgi:Tol biopolymer transport system component